MTVSEVSKAFHVSTRMLRYYEKVGLLVSSRKEDYAYRVYDKIAIRRLQQIVILRKLRIPLRQIAIILDDQEQFESLKILQENISEINGEINALSTIRNILNTFIMRLDHSIQNKVHLDILEEQELNEIANALILPKLNLKEEHSMTELNNANGILESKMDIRIVYLPPSTVVASHYIGDNPEEVAGRELAEFIKKVNLPVEKPDLRVYGFNNPSPQEGQDSYGYEFWATIPENIEIPEKLKKKEFAGGLYAAHCIKIGDFQEWGPFFEQINNS
ncbi:effector binding domain-containing protein [Anaerosporobacter sp.]